MHVQLKLQAFSQRSHVVEVHDLVLPRITTLGILGKKPSGILITELLHAGIDVAVRLSGRCDEASQLTFELFDCPNAAPYQQEWATVRTTLAHTLLIGSVGLPPPPRGVLPGKTPEGQALYKLSAHKGISRC